MNIMWYPLLNCSLNSTQQQGGYLGLDLNVRSAWQNGYTGKQVIVTILDDGIERDHPDLVGNYVSTLLQWKI